jgi:hypothetical protein
MARWPLAYTALGRRELELATTHLRAAEAFGEESGAPDLLLAATWGLAELSILTGDYEDRPHAPRERWSWPDAPVNPGDSRRSLSPERGPELPPAVAAKLNAGLPGRPSSLARSSGMPRRRWTTLRAC